jgi:hypothetical protein
MLALLLDDSLPGAGRRQWEIPGLHSHKCAVCAITVAGQWRIFTALPEHSVAGQGLMSATDDTCLTQEGEIQFVSDAAVEVKGTKELG